MLVILVKEVVIIHNNNNSFVKNALMKFLHIKSIFVLKMETKKLIKNEPGKTLTKLQYIC